MSKSRLKIKLNIYDKIIEIVTFLEIVVLFIITLIYYNKLPDTIPTHFNFAGIPDNFGDKISIWFMPAVAVLTYILLVIINKFPHLHNYPVEITEENAEKVYRTGTQMIRFINFLIVSIFLNANIETIKIAMGKQKSNLTSVTLLLVIAIFLVIFFYFIKIRKAAKSI